MYAAEKLFKSMSCKDLYHTLYSIIDNDYYLKDFTVTRTSDDFLYVLEMYDLVFVASDDRVLLTPIGEKVLQQLNQMLI